MRNKGRAAMARWSERRGHRESGSLRDGGPRPVRKGRGPGCVSCALARPGKPLAASSLVMRLRRARDEGRPGREPRQLSKAGLPVAGGLGFPQPGAGGARLLSQVLAQAYGRQSAALAANPGLSGRGAVLGDDQMAAAVADGAARHGGLARLEGEPCRVRRALMSEA